MKYKFIKIKNHPNDIVELIFNNPDSRNALNDIMLNEIIDFLESLKKKNCRILIISGEGKAFSAGADLEWMKRSINLTTKENQKDALPR